MKHHVIHCQRQYLNFFHEIFSFCFLCSFLVYALGDGGEVLILLEKIKYILQVLLIEHFHWALDIAVGGH